LLLRPASDNAQLMRPLMVDRFLTTALDDTSALTPSGVLYDLRYDLVLILLRDCVCFVHHLLLRDKQVEMNHSIQGSSRSTLAYQREQEIYRNKLRCFQVEHLTESH